jgi:hypothetical protein
MELETSHPSPTRRVAPIIPDFDILIKLDGQKSILEAQCESARHGKAYSRLLLDEESP